MKRIQWVIRCLVAIAIGVSVNSVQSNEESHPRVIVSLDACLSCENPEDIHSLIYLLWYSDEIELVGLIPESFEGEAGVKGIESILRVLDAYEQDFSNPEFAFEKNGHPSPESLRALVPKNFTSAFELLTNEAHREHSGPLYVLTWGNLKFLKEALGRDPSIASSIRVISVASRTNYNACRETNLNGWGRDTLFRDPRFNNLWWLEMDWTQAAMNAGDQPQKLLDALSPYGSLGALAVEESGQADWSKGFRLGDAVSLMFLIDPDGNREDPSQPSWAGRFLPPQPEERPQYYTDDMGDLDWDFEKPCRTWIDRKLALNYCQRRILENRATIHSALLKKVNSIYPTQKMSASIASYEAENADLTDDLLVRSDLEASHGFYVEMKDRGKITWIIDNVPSEGEYKLRIRYKLPFLYKTQRLVVNDQEVGPVKFDGTPRTWQEKVFTVHLRKGKNRVTFEKDWGYMDFDTAILALNEP